LRASGDRPVPGCCFASYPLLYSFGPSSTLEQKREMMERCATGAIAQVDG
jgi:hypothetical protein